MRNHRVPLLGDSWRRMPDPDRSADRRVQLVLAGLRDLAEAPAPEPTFRAELRAQLVAITPRVVAEGELEAAPALPSRATRPLPRAVTASGGAPLSVGAGSGRGSGGFHIGVTGAAVRRVAAATTCTVVAMAMLLGVALYLSRNSVPGDALYGLKRASENFQLATDSDSAKPGDLLRFAGRRVEEAQTLASRGQASASGSGVGAAAVNSTTSNRISDALASADSDVRQAARMLGDQAVSSASAAPLTTITSWAPAQLDRLHQLWSTLGASSPASSKVTQSAHLVTSATDRAKALGAKVDCGCLKSAPSDSLGPKPCTACSSTSTKSATAKPAKGTHVSVPGGSVVHNGGGNPATTHVGTLGPVSTPTSALPTKVPTLPIKSVSLPTTVITPVSVGSCGVKVDVLGVTVSVGSCTTP